MLLHQTKAILQFMNINNVMLRESDVYLRGLDFDKFFCKFLYTPSSYATM